MPMTSVRMPDQLMNKLEAIAEKLDRSKGWIIKDAVSQYVERMDRREKMLVETRLALADVEEGNVIDGEDVITWIESWGTADEKVPPTI